MKQEVDASILDATLEAAKGEAISVVGIDVGVGGDNEFIIGEKFHVAVEEY